jgi:DNA-binding response OmpR family regulator
MARLSNGADVTPCLLYAIGIGGNFEDPIARETKMIAKRKILVIEDDDDLRQSLQEQLTMTDEYRVFAAETAARGIELIKNELPDLLVLDVGLPDMDGREVCKRLRKQHFKKPIILITGNSTDADQILGFDSGANDYVIKPFKFPVLVARIRVHLRQHDQGEDAVFVIGPYSFKPAGKVLFCQKGCKIRLTEKETLMLKRLYEAGGKAVSREHLMREVWGCYSHAASRTLDTHIYRLRQKIEKTSSRSELLVTEDHGYRLTPNGNLHGHGDTHYSETDQSTSAKRAEPPLRVWPIG